MRTTPTSAGSTDITTTVPDRLRAFAERFDPQFASLLEPQDHVPATLLEAVRYAALSGGKRIRPYLVDRCCALVGGDAAQSLLPAAAVECVHAFSLIHDDLPAMDDDDLRRGQPTCHRKFGEAAAILAGDALVVLAFELLARAKANPAIAAKMVAELAAGTGWRGMIGGQAADIAGESSPPDEQLVSAIHDRKTASLMQAACRLGALAGGAAPEAVERLGRFGLHFGRAFQIADDLLDVTASAEKLGKKTGKDAEAKKQTLPRCVGIGASRDAARRTADAAVAELEPFGPAADELRSLATFVVLRDY